MKRIVAYILIVFQVLILSPYMNVSASAANVADARHVSSAERQTEEARFPILKSAGAQTLCGVAGMTILARFEDGQAPGEIYVGRDAVEANLVLYGTDTPYVTQAIARVTDPKGVVRGVYEFPLTSGYDGAVFNIDVAVDGIWSIQIMGCRGGDKCTIGITETENWGFRGDKVIFRDSTEADETVYIYAGPTSDFILVGAGKTANADFILKDKNGTTYEMTDAVYSAETPVHPNFINRRVTYIKDVIPESVYSLTINAAYEGLMVIDGISGLMCPTLDAAENLKGGWETVEGVTVQGAFQKRAREEAIRIVNEKDLTVNASVLPENVLGNIENPMAEAQLFGDWGVISGLRAIIDSQNLDTSSSYLGLATTQCGALNGCVMPPEKDFQSCHFEELFEYTLAMSTMSVAAGLPLELNGFKGNVALANRAALSMLGAFTQMSEEGFLRSKNLLTNTYPFTAAMFEIEDILSSYILIEDYLDLTTRTILKEGIQLLIDQMGTYRGQGPTNQYLFTMSAVLNAYKIFGTERYHETFKRQIVSVMENTGAGLGINDAGFFEESAGCDGSYSYMNLCLFYHMYNEYKKTPTADLDILEDMKATVQKSLEFESFFWTRQPLESNLTGIYPNCFNSRTNSVFGDSGYPSYSLVWHEFPLARRRHELTKLNPEKVSGNTYPYRINNEDWALNFIDMFYDDYDNRFVNSGYADWSLYSMDAFTAEEKCAPAETLPYEAPDGTYWDRVGFTAFKDNGFYGYSFYGVPNSTTSKPYSYMGGGPTFLWSDGLGAVVVSKKHLEYGIFGVLDKENEVVSSCIYSADDDGTLTFCSGKEGTPHYSNTNPVTLERSSDGFTLSGKVPETDITAVWKYENSADGLRLTAKLEGYDSDKEYWLNIPLCVSESDMKVSLQNNSVIMQLGKNRTIIEYGANQEVFLEEGNIECLQDKIKRFRVKLDKNGEAQLLFRNELSDIIVSECNLKKNEDIIEILRCEKSGQKISVKLKNTTSLPKDLTFYCAQFDANEYLSVKCKTVSIGANELKTVEIPVVPGSDCSVIRLMLWESDSLVPMIIPITRTVET